MIQLKIDVSGMKKAYGTAEIPGVKIGVTIDGNLVAISAEIKNEKEVTEGKKVLRSERYYGKISRSFTLAQEVDEGTRRKPNTATACGPHHQNKRF